MNNNANDHHSAVYSRWKKENKDSESFSRDVGYHYSHSFLDDCIIKYPLPEKIFQAWQDSGGREPWVNLHNVLGREIGQKITNVIRREEMEGYALDHDEFATGFFQLFTDLWADMDRLRSEE